MKPRAADVALAATLAFSFAGLPASAQVRQPQISPSASVTQRIGVQDVTITYSRPAVKGRRIWGDLVPNGEVWRTGANQATTISFAEDVTVDGKPLAAGTYALFTIPSDGDWTLVFSRNAKQWGSAGYDAKDDALRVTRKPVAAPMTESLLFTFDDVRTNSARVTLAWERKAVSFTVANVKDAVATTLAAYRDATAKAKSDDWQAFASAAQFCADQKVGLDEGLTWADKAIAANGTTAWPYWVKAHLLKAAGKDTEALALLDKALETARAEGDKGFLGEIPRRRAEWTKKG